MNLNRRHRAFTLALAALAAGIFMIFITQVFLSDSPEVKPRTCAFSELYVGMSYQDMQRTYHWTMQELIEERMDLYEGKTSLVCSEDKMEDIIPAGSFASEVASRLRAAHPNVRISDPLKYSEFEELLYEVWRTYDCDLFSLDNNPIALSIAMDWDKESVWTVYHGREEVVGRERDIARRTYDRLLTVIRSSEQYLPLHASLRCLQRGSTDVRNAFSLLSDATQCLPASLSQPETSLLK